MTGPRLDLKGKRFGRLIPTLYLSNGNWECKCDCGNTTIVTGGNLKTGNTKSCGCYLRENIKNFRLHDFTGEKVGHLTVIKRLPDNPNMTGGEKRRWLCRCDCGKELEKSSRFLGSKTRKFCGDKACKCYVPLKFEDLTGRRQGKLTVLYRDFKYESDNHQSQPVYLCKCDCGKLKHIKSNNLKKGQQSCGCQLGTSFIGRKAPLRISKKTINFLGNTVGAYKVTAHAQELWTVTCNVCGQTRGVSSVFLKNLKDDKCHCSRIHGNRKMNPMDTVGHLTLLEYSSESKKWLCRCDCGNEDYYTQSTLKTRTECYQCNPRKHNNYSDVSLFLGKRFGHLIVTGCESGNYICQCDCGNTIRLKGYALITGTKKSCGCGMKKYEKATSNNTAC